MTPSNLPPGVREGMLPGSRPDDVERRSVRTIVLLEITQDVPDGETARSFEDVLGLPPSWRWPELVGDYAIAKVTAIHSFVTREIDGSSPMDAVREPS